MSGMNTALGWLYIFLCFGWIWYVVSVPLALWSWLVGRESIRYFTAVVIQAIGIMAITWLVVKTGESFFS